MAAIIGKFCSSSSGSLGIPTNHILLHPGSDPTEHSTVTDALASAVAGDVITTKAGPFTEDFTLPNGVSLIGSPGSVMTGTLTIEGGSTVRQFTIKVPAGSTGIIYNASSATTTPVIRNIRFIGQGSGVGLAMTGAPDIQVKTLVLYSGTLTSLITSGSSVSARLTACDVIDAAACTGSAYLLYGAMTLKDCNCSGESLNGYGIGGGDITLDECQSIGATAAGLKISGGAATLSACDFTGATYGVQVSGTATLDASTSRFHGGTTDLLVAAAASGSTITATGCHYSTHDIPASLKASTRFQSIRFSEVEGQRGQHVNSEQLSVGSHYRADEFYWGQGGPYSDDMLVFSNTNLEAGTFADHTEDAISADGSTFASLPANTAGACLYIGSTANRVPAFYMKVPTACTGAGEVIFEGWTGAAWVEMNSFSAYAEDALDWAGNYPLEIADNQNLRVGDYVAGPATAPVHEWDRLALYTLDGESAYWYRWRLVTPYTAIGTIEQILCQGHSGKQSQYGREFFGTLIKSTDASGWSLAGLHDCNGSIPSNRDLAWTSGTAPDEIEFNNNPSFSNGARDAVGQVLDLPSWADPSRGMNVQLRWVSISTNTGDVEIQVRWALRSDGDVLTATGIDGTVSVVVAVDGTDDKTYKHTVHGGVFGSANTDQLGLTLTRDASGARVLDTLTDHIVLISTKLRMNKYRAA